MGRFLAFSDGVFAFAATLLVVSLAAPIVGHDQESDLTSKLVALWPKALACAISFLVVTSFWSAHRQLFRRIRRLDETLTARNEWGPCRPWHIPQYSPSRFRSPTRAHPAGQCTSRSS
jgi:uncharacterized membrane protein